MTADSNDKDANGLDLHKTGVGPAPVVARVTSRISITGGWILDVQFLDHNQPAHARVRVYTNTDIHVNDTIAIAGRPSITVGGQLMFDATKLKGKVAHTHTKNADTPSWENLA